MEECGLHSSEDCWRAETFDKFASDWLKTLKNGEHHPRDLEGSRWLLQMIPIWVNALQSCGGIFVPGFRGNVVERWRSDLMMEVLELKNHYRALKRMDETQTESSRAAKGKGSAR